MEEVTEGIVAEIPWVNLICFPELFLSGTNQFVSTANGPSMMELTETIPGPLTNRLCDLAKRVGSWLIPGSFYEKEAGKVYNASIVISPEGEIVAHYRKLYPWQPQEKETPGNLGFCVWDIPGIGRLGLCICYDMWIPEVSRSLAWLGAEVIFHPSRTSTSDRIVETKIAQANAIFNQCFFIDVNIVGQFGGGRSQIVDPDGQVLQLATEHESILTQVLDLDHVSRARDLGTMGLAQVWKAFRDIPVAFPPYTQAKVESPLLSNLGKPQFPRDMRN